MKKKFYKVLTPNMGSLFFPSHKWEEGKLTPVVNYPAICFRGWHYVDKDNLATWLIKECVIHEIEPAPNAKVVKGDFKYAASKVILGKRIARISENDCRVLSSILRKKLLKYHYAKLSKKDKAIADKALVIVNKHRSVEERKEEFLEFQLKIKNESDILTSFLEVLSFNLIFGWIIQDNPGSDVSNLKLLAINEFFKRKGIKA